MGISDWGYNIVLFYFPEALPEFWRWKKNKVATGARAEVGLGEISLPGLPDRHEGGSRRTPIKPIQL